MIKKNPVFGNGLGAAITSRKGGLVEYFYHDILNKTGVLGLLLYFFPIGYMACSFIRKGRRGDTGKTLLNIVWLSGLGVFLLVTYFNPYMNSSLGICCYSIAIACFRLRTSPASGEASEGQPRGHTSQQNTADVMGN